MPEITLEKATAIARNIKESHLNAVEDVCFKGLMTNNEDLLIEVFSDFLPLTKHEKNHSGRILQIRTPSS